MKNIFHTLAVNFLFLIALFTGNLEATIINVPVDSPSIQGAVNMAAISGDTIQIAAGTYIEQIQIIDKSLDIIGAGEGNTIIQAPDASIPLTEYFTYSNGNRHWCIIIIDNQAAPTAQVVNVSQLTLNGDNQQDTTTLPAPSAGFYGSQDRFYAIGYHNAGGTVQYVHITSLRQSSNFNELAGGGIVNASDIGSTGSVNFTTQNCLIDFYQRIGVDCRGAALTATITNNTINRGYVLTPNTSTASPIGIQYTSGTFGSITNNIVESNISTVVGAQSTGILPISAGVNIVVSGNILVNNDVGIVAEGNGDNLLISNNTINFTTTQGVNTTEGIIVQDTDGLSTITSNIMNNLPDINMEIISDASNEIFQLSHNQFNGSQIGLRVTGGTTFGPQITMNGDSFTGTSGYYIQEVAAPNDIWPSTATVTFDGLISGQITFAQFNQILTKIYDKHNDPSLGLVLDFIAPTTPQPPSSFVGILKKNRFLNKSAYVLTATWTASPSSNIVSYRIFREGYLVDQVPATSPFLFVACICKPSEAGEYTIVAVNSSNVQSNSITLVIP